MPNKTGKQGVVPKIYEVRAKINVFGMDSPWHYIPIPENCVPKVRPGGWGSIRVTATIGKTTWKTSLFPIKGGQYFLPIKKQVLNQENLKAGGTVQATHTLQ
ncbi:MAG: DUF1905 domain-containing protein [Patescibacteria group bacterium]